jgi:hypothetical protein
MANYCPLYCTDYSKANLNIAVSDKNYNQSNVAFPLKNWNIKTVKQFRIIAIAQFPIQL